MFFYYSEKEKRYTDQLNLYLKQSNEDVFFAHELKSVNKPFIPRASGRSNKVTGYYISLENLSSKNIKRVF